MKALTYWHFSKSRRPLVRTLMQILNTGMLDAACTLPPSFEPSAHLLGGTICKQEAQHPHAQARQLADPENLYRLLTIRHCGPPAPLGLYKRTGHRISRQSAVTYLKSNLLIEAGVICTP